MDTHTESASPTPSAPVGDERAKESGHESETPPADHEPGPGTAVSSRWGRIATDGTVFVRASDGEREIGSWQAGTPEEGLAFFRRQYADLKVQVEVLEQRVERSLVSSSEGVRKAAELTDAVGQAHAIGDLEGLLTRLTAVVGKAEEAKAKQSQERAAMRVKAVERRTALVEEAEALIDSTAWKATGERMRAIFEEMRQAHGIDRQTDQALWKRYQTARDEFSRRRGTHFAGLDEARKHAQAQKEELITRAESLADSTEWRSTGDAMKSMMAEWKTLPRAGRDAEDALWRRFRTAQDTFFHKRAESFEQREAEFKDHLAEKERMLAEVESVDVTKDLETARRKLRDLKSRWDDIGRVPRESMGSLDARIRTLDEKVRRAHDTAWRESRAASNPLAEQFREQIARLEAQATKARAAGRVADAERAENAATSWRASLEEAEKRRS